MSGRHHNTLEPLDLRTAPRDTLLHHMTIHEARICKQSIAAQDKLLEARQVAGGPLPLETGDRAAIAIPALHFGGGKGFEAQAVEIGAGLGSARLRQPVFGKKKRRTVDDDEGNCLAGCFVVGAPTAGRTPRDLPPLSPHLQEHIMNAAVPSEAQRELIKSPRSSRKRQVPTELYDDVALPTVASVTTPLHEQLSLLHHPHPPLSPSALLSGSLSNNLLLRAALQPRRFHADSGVFGEISNEVAKAKPRGKSRRFNESYWGHNL